MNRIFLSLTLLLITCIESKAQNLEFDPPVVITDITIISTGFSGPLIPWDYDNDSLIDFFGVTNRAFMKASEQGYERVDIFGFFSGAAIRTMDFDGNGKLDYISTTALLLNLGDGNIQVIRNNELKIYENICEVADFDNDGYMDYITGHYWVNSSTGDLKIWYNNGDNTFTDTILAQNFACKHVLVQDLNADGYTDIIATGGGKKDIYYLQPNRMYEKAGFEPSLKFVEKCLNGIDVDKDLDTDLILYRDSIGFSALKYTDGEYESNFESNILSCKDVVMFDKFDLNGDGNEELVLVYNFDNKITIAYFTIDQDFSFGEIVNIASFADFPATYSHGVGNGLKRILSFIDFDYDGKIDIIYSDGFAKKIHLLKNLTAVGTKDDFIFESFTINTFPNPVLNEIQIELGNEKDVECLILNANGQVVKNYRLLENSNRLDLGYLNPGNYILQLKSSNFIKNHPILKF